MRAFGPLRALFLFEWRAARGLLLLIGGLTAWLHWQLGRLATMTDFHDLYDARELPIGEAEWTLWWAGFSALLLLWLAVPGDLLRLGAPAGRDLWHAALPVGRVGRMTGRGAAVAVQVLVIGACVWSVTQHYHMVGPVPRGADALLVPWRMGADEHLACGLVAATAAGALVPSRLGAAVVGIAVAAGGNLHAGAPPAAAGLLLCAGLATYALRGPSRDA